MNVLIIGSGGREHALCVSCKNSEKINNIFCMPGNAGTDLIAKNVLIDINNFVEVEKFVKENEIEINGTPNDNREYNIKFIIEELITNFKETGIKNINIKDQIANLLSKQMAI